MSVILTFLAVPWLAASGIYNPPVTHHGRYIAEPVSAVIARIDWAIQ
jgi:hypothetical protein